MRKQSTLGVCILLVCIMSLQLNPAIASECLVTGTVNSMDDPLAPCDGFTTIRITGTLVIQANDYDISHFASLETLIVDGGLIFWQSAKNFNLPAGAKLKLINGGMVESVGGGCNSIRSLSFGGVTAASCNGVNAPFSFADINGAGGVDMGGLLPVEWSRFEGKEEASGVRLFWETASETENDRFDIEYSRDGRFFEKIGQVKGAGTTTEAASYEFVHHNAGRGANYYRLKQVDFDGTFSYSPVIAVEVEEGGISKGSFTISPNPAGGLVFVDVDNRDETAEVWLYNAIGQKWMLEYVNSGPGMSITLPAGLTPGTYYLQLRLQDQQMAQPVVIF